MLYRWGSQPLRWFPVIPDCWYWLTCILLSRWVDLLTHIPNEETMAEVMSLWRLGYTKTSFLGTLSRSLWGMRCHLTMQAPPYAEAHVASNWSWPTTIWVRLEVDPPPVEVGDDCSPGWYFTACKRLGATQLTCSLAHRNHENLSVCCVSAARCWGDLLHSNSWLMQLRHTGRV